MSIFTRTRNVARNRELGNLSMLRERRGSRVGAAIRGRPVQLPSVCDGWLILGQLLEQGVPFNQRLELLPLLGEPGIEEQLKLGRRELRSHQRRVLTGI